MNQTLHKTVSVFPQADSKGYQFESGVFGVNMEITRKGFFGGICAQMLNNRKLFMGKDGVDGWECQNFERILDRPEESLCESNFVILKDGGSMSQTSSVIALQKGKKYEVKASQSVECVVFEDENTALLSLCDLTYDEYKTNDNISISFKTNEKPTQIYDIEKGAKVPFEYDGENGVCKTTVSIKDFAMFEIKF